MPRNVSAAMMTALSSSVLRPALFFKATFKTGPTYFWTGWGTITWQGQTWSGVGSFASISNIEELSSVEARGVVLGVNGLDPVLLSDCLNEVRLGNPVTVWLGLFDTNGTLIDQPLIAWQGRMDQPTLTVSGDSASLTIACENRLLDMNVPSERRYTDADQQMDHAGDRGFEFVNSIQQQTIYWGRTPSSTNNM